MKGVIKKLSAVLLSGVFFLILAFSTFAQDTFTLQPWIYDPDNTNGVVSTTMPDGSLHLEKNVPTSTNASAGAKIMGVEDLDTTGMTLGFDVNGYCGAGAPRFNVYLSGGSVVFLGCIYGDPENDGSVMFSAGNSYGGVLFPEGQTVERIDIIQDEQGQTTLSNIMVNGQPVEVTRNTLSLQCKNGRWQNFATPTFRNQGQCVSYFMRSYPKGSPTAMPSVSPTGIGVTGP